MTEIKKFADWKNRLGRKKKKEEGGEKKKKHEEG